MDIHLSRFTADGVAIDNRLRARPTVDEVCGLVLALGALGLFVWAQGTSLASFDAYDYHNYIRAARGDYRHYYYGYWFLPVFSLLSLLPEPGGFVVWNILNLLGVWFAARVFGGRAGPALLSYQMLGVLFYGQITGVLLGGAALLWWAMAHRRWHLAGLGMLIAGTKFLLGGPWALFLWLLAEARWRDRLRVLLVPAAVVALSLVIYPLWPLQTLQTLRNNPPDARGSIAPWQWIGPAALLFWLPPLLLPLARENRLLALAAAVPLALPYFQQMDLLTLFVLPIGWLPPLFGNVGYLFAFLSWPAYYILLLLPVTLYVVAIAPAIRALRRRKQPPPAT